jgi:hypothetical protein
VDANLLQVFVLAMRGPWRIKNGMMGQWAPTSSQLLIAYCATSLERTLALNTIKFQMTEFQPYNIYLCVVEIQYGLIKIWKEKNNKYRLVYIKNAAAIAQSI